MEFKTEQSKRNWDKYKIIYVVMLIITIVVVKYFLKLCQLQVKKTKIVDLEGDGSALLYGRGSENDDTETLLNRLEWSTYYESRVTRWYRMILITIIIVLLIILLGIRKLPKPSTLIILFLVVFITMFATNNFYYAHGDVYNDYYMWKNIQFIRRRLYGNAKYKNPGKPHCSAEIPKRVDAMNQQ